MRIDYHEGYFYSPGHVDTIVLCEDCLPQKIDPETSDEIYPIFAGQDEYDHYPCCDTCHREFDYVCLTQDGYQWLLDRQIENTKKDLTERIKGIGSMTLCEGKILDADDLSWLVICDMGIDRDILRCLDIDDDRDALWEILEQCAPEEYFFGAHYGDPACIGFWPVEHLDSLF